MNVLIAASYKAPQGGNFIPSSIALATELRKAGNSVTFIFPYSENAARTGSWREWLENLGFQVYLIDRDVPSAKLLAELKEIIQKHQIDILHTHFGIYKKLLTKYRSELPVKVLIHDHFDFGFSDGKLKQWVRNTIKSVIYRRLRIGVVAVNKAVAKSFGFARHWYVANGLSLMRNVERSRTREECRMELGIRDDEKACLILGWSLDVKGLDVAVKAVSECRKRGHNTILCIVGFGSTPKESVISYIKERCGMDPHSKWIRYWDDTEDMFAYHRAADVFLSASRSEGFSYAVLEAISQNTPVVLSDIRGTKWAYSYQHAFPYAVEDTYACADSIEKAMQVGKSASNYQTIADMYSIENWCRSMITIYESL